VEGRAFICRLTARRTLANWQRYLGGTAYAVAAAGHGSGNLFFVAAAPQDPKERCRLEASVIYALQPQYNNQHMKRSPLDPCDSTFAGDVPRGLRSGLTVRCSQPAGRSPDAVLRVYDATGNVIETYEHKGDFKEW
jgi:hypothetical protein